MGNPLPHDRIVNGKREVLPPLISGQTRPGLNRVRASRSNWQNYLEFHIVVSQGVGSRDPVLTGCGSERAKQFFELLTLQVGIGKSSL
jgi:hypothetical protein